MHKTVWAWLVISIIAVAGAFALTLQAREMLQVDGYIVSSSWTGQQEKRCTRYFRISKAGCNVRITINPGECDGAELQYLQFVSDGTTSYFVTKFDTAVLRSKGVLPKVATAANEATVEVRPTLHPPFWAGGAVTTPWLAYNAGCVLTNSGDVVPVFGAAAIPRAVIESIDRIKLRATWSRKTSASDYLERFTDYRDGVIEVDKGHRKRTMPPFADSFTNSCFEVLHWTNYAGVELPARFEWRQFALSGTNVAGVHIGQATNITLVAGDIERFKPPEKSRIAEYRFSQELRDYGIPPYMYFSTNSDIFGPSELRSILPRRLQMTNRQHHIRNFVYVALGIVLFGPIFVFAGNNLRNKTKTIKLTNKPR